MKRGGNSALAIAAACAFLAALAGCGDSSGPNQPDAPSAPRLFPGGETTVFEATSHAFALPAPNLSPPHAATHVDGDAAFDRTFVTSPAPLFGGLGPIFNNASCAGCHVRNGRGRESLLLRVSVAGVDANGGPAPVPGFGGQIQDRAIIGRAPEAKVVATTELTPGQFADGKPYTLARSSFALAAPYASLPAVAISPRFGPAVFGLGLLEAISDAAILAREDLNDADGDGISGKANLVWDVAAEELRVGRFGWKAGQPNLRQQTAAAYNQDMGITSPLLPAESSAGQSGHDDGRADDPEIDDETLDVTTFYVQTLGVPAPRRIDDARVARGEQIFQEARCVSCHVPSSTTGANVSLPEMANQTIYPYTDLLLHDMGPGLADGRAEFLADGQEWRTAPLWGIGLLETVNGEIRLLHDGRAGSFLEAVLWHGGEAEASREHVRNLSEADREALAAFLGSL